LTFPRLVAVAGIVVLIGGAYAYGHFGKSPWYLAVAAIGLVMLVAAPHLNARNM
jgi:general stress protein CsbA